MGLTVSSQDKRNEEPCSRSDELIGMQEGHTNEENDKDNGCCFRGVVFVGCPASVR